ncbi:MAG: hypothetical protein A2030_01515 [Chloroflexi bacterium RBG_19FT_COMBO_50_10]|nr:MAG: hypothetical protein A2030_01515 [Chloroflexi bacterium RBG_19FT_COMBO_50_10]
MKKIISLSIPIGLLVILFTVTLLFARVSEASSANPFTSGDSPEPEQIGPPWYNEAWHYRQPVIISSGASLPYYQVLLKLDNNFDFSRAKADGSDIRFTHSDGTTELKYWVESWDGTNKLAYVWVRVPSVALGGTVIYLYYNNPAAVSASDGTATFDNFDDDWSQFTGEKFNQDEETQILHSSEEVDSPFVWSTISGSPEAASGILSLAAGTGIKSNSIYQNSAMGMRANFGLGAGKEWGGFINGDSGQQTTIGDLTFDPGNLYLVNNRNVYESVLLQRVGGNDWHNAYHIYEVRWNPVQSVGDIDHDSSSAVSTQPTPNINLPVTLYSYIGSNATLMVDWVYVRQYHDPEPTIVMGTEQGLVELSINNIDSPDPLRAGVRLTYQLTISNTSSINAPGVVVTDTLPGNVQIGPVSSSQGSCVPGSVILCNLDDIHANSIARITIIVTPTIDGEITNTALVSSPGYELDLSDNTREQVTLVDSVRPVVNWEEPVKKEETYTAFGGLVTLEASATDNDQVAWVEFRLWNHYNNEWISIGTDNTYPYQILFNSSMLEMNDPYQMFVLGTDRAGNQSNPYDPLQRIFIVRRLPVFLPLTIK